MRRLAVVCVAVVTAALVAAAPAAASWAQQDTAAEGGATTWSFNAVSCPTASFCMAVGGFSSSGGSGLLAESRTGSTWTDQIPPNITGNAESLSSISCTSSTACMAVGSYYDGTNTVSLAESWNGSSWTILTPPNPGGATTTELSRVSCTSSTACIAVGSDSNGTNTFTLAEAWNGSSWSIQSTPNPAGATTASFNGISCRSASGFCIAVGSAQTGTTTVTLAEAWNGSAWSIQTTPSPTGSAGFNGVSCTTASACTAVGYGLAEHWNGTSWTVQTVQDPHGNTAGAANLISVSCTSATPCTAVGTYYLDAVLTMVAESWDGTAWRVQSTSLSTSADSSALDDVSCNNPTTCTAVGSYHDPTTGDRALAEVSALKWQLQSPATPPGSLATGFTGVSCTSPGFCAGVGNFETSSDFETFAETWDGTGWTIQSTPNASNSNLSGVTCTLKTNCYAVGDVLSGGVLVPLVEHWDGTAWTAQSLTAPAGATASFLLAVACRTASTCTAVGFYRMSGNEFTFAERWNGSTWTLQSTPNPAGATFSHLNGVACATVTTCTAVGSYTAGSSGMLVETWNGTTWTIQSTPNPPGGSNSYLASVACRSVSACTATGDYFDGSHTVAMSEIWNGTSWTTEVAAAPPSAIASGLSGVSCAAVNSCEGVGYFRTSKNQPLAENWIGTLWTVQAATPPSGAQANDLVGVSCPSAIWCMAVGWFNDSTSTENNLAYQLS